MPPDDDAVGKARAGDFAGARHLLAVARSRSPSSLDSWFDEAQICRLEGDDIGALRCYRHILSVDTGNKAARNLMSMLLADLGAPGLALETADRGEKMDPGTRRYVERARAGQLIRWNEPEAATNMLSRIIAGAAVPKDRNEERFDLVLALAAMNEDRAVIEAYDALVADDVEIPYWIHDAAASSSLDLGDRRRAIELYEKAIVLRPDDFQPRMGLYQAQVDGERFRAAGRTLDRLKGGTPEWREDDGILRYGWNREEAYLEWGWWLAHQNRMSEAYEVFSELLDRAPANLGARAGLAQIELWRGHPRAALSRFNVILTMAEPDLLPNPPYEYEHVLPVKIGRAAALNACGYEVEARSNSAVLLERNPQNTHVRNLCRDLEIEDSLELLVDAVGVREDSGVREAELLVRLTQPISPPLSGYVYGFRRGTDGEDDTRYEIQRVGVGMTWDVIRPATVTAEMSRDVKTGDSPGAMVQVNVEACDHWSVSAGHQTYSLDVPFRARAAGVEGRKTDAGIQYRYSEALGSRLGASRNELDDGNRNEAFSWYSDVSLLERAWFHNWLMIEASWGRNSDTNVPYFSPDHDSTLMLTHRMDHRLMRRYDRYWLHRLYTGGGYYEQDLFDRQFIWDVRYEHEFQVSAWTVLLLGIGQSHRYYDGVPADASTAYLTFRKHF